MGIFAISLTNGSGPASWRRCAFVSLSLWGIYGVVETLLTSYLPLLTQNYFIFIANPFVLFALLFFFYPFLGVAQATLLSLVLKGQAVTTKALWSISLLLFTLIFTIHALCQGIWAVIPGAFCVALLAVFLWRRGEESLSPWLAVVFLTGIIHLWEARPYWPWFVRLFLIVLFITFSMGILWVAKKTLGKKKAWEALLFRSSPLSVFLILFFLFLGLFLFLFKKPELKQLKGVKGVASDLPPIVLIVWDSARLDHLSLYGYEKPTTPNLERFYQEGATLYRNHFAVSNYTLPTHVTIFTGVGPCQHGVISTPQNPYGFSFADRYVTLPLFLSQQGYRNMAFVANFSYVSGELDFSKGFSYYENRSKTAFLNARRGYFFREGVRRLAVKKFGTKWLAIYKTAGELTDQSLGILDRDRGGKIPIFLFYNFMDAHSPYVPPEPFKNRFGDPALGEAVGYGEKIGMDNRALSPEKHGLLQRYMTSQYDGGLAYMDHHFGRLMDGLKKRGLYEKALIILISDHGEFLGEEGRYGHGVTLENIMIHVPLLVKYPGQKLPVAVDEIVSQIDIFPTVVDVLGLPTLKDFSGKSLRSLLPDPLRIVMAESNSPRENTGSSWRMREVSTEVALMCAGRKRVYAFEGSGLSPYSEMEEPFKRVLKEYILIRQQKGTRKPALTEERRRKVIKMLKTIGYI